MSSGGFDPSGPDDGPGWREPEHLGQGAGHPWSGEASGPAGSAEAPAARPDPAAAPEWTPAGWAFSDGAGPRDAALGELIATAPVARLGPDYLPERVLRGRFGSLELVAFDVVFVSRRYRVPQYAVTAAPLLLPVPVLRLSPARLWKHRAGGLLHLPSGDPELDARWVLLTAEDAPAVRRLAADPGVRALLLESDDGDEFWSAAGHLSAIRPDGHNPALLEHHGRLLTAMVGALMSAG
jgi:hypothetical protein